MKFKIFLRPALSIVFGFFGAFVARSGTPPDIFAITGDYFVFVAFVAFAVLGFILPDIVELAGKAGIAVLAKQIAERIQSASTSRLSVPKISLRRRHNNTQTEKTTAHTRISCCIKNPESEVSPIAGICGVLIAK